jgi:hypothetical protein
MSKGLETKRSLYTASRVETGRFRAVGQRAQPHLGAARGHERGVIPDAENRKSTSHFLRGVSGAKNNRRDVWGAMHRYRRQKKKKAFGRRVQRPEDNNWLPRRAKMGLKCKFLRSLKNNTPCGGKTLEPGRAAPFPFRHPPRSVPSYDVHVSPSVVLKEKNKS